MYIQEAHPSDLWQVSANLRDEVIYANPATVEERLDVANACVRNLGIEIPALLDSLENEVERDYTAWPDRLYLIDEEGRVAYKSAPGPFGFRPAQLEGALRQALGLPETAD